MALAMIAVLENITWRNMGKEVIECQFLIVKTYLRIMPSWQKIYAVWREIRTDSFERLIEQYGIIIAREPKEIAVDSQDLK